MPLETERHSYSDLRLSKLMRETDQKEEDEADEAKIDGQKLAMDV